MADTSKSADELDEIVALVSAALERCDAAELRVPAIDLSSALEKLKALREPRH